MQIKFLFCLVIIDSSITPHSYVYIEKKNYQFFDQISMILV